MIFHTAHYTIDTGQRRTGHRIAAPDDVYAVAVNQGIELTAKTQSRQLFLLIDFFAHFASLR
jgi:hypothetical protein